MLTLCMIVKNEELVIEKCLEKASKFVDEIIIVDTGSSDNTKKIAEKYTKKIYGFNWCDDFAKARNFSIEKATNDWIIVLDADEEIEKANIKNIKQFIENNPMKVGRIKRINEYEDLKDNISTKHSERISRIFNRKYFKYEGIIHEQIVPKENSKIEHTNIDICINHTGYSHEIVKRTNKFERNRLLLKKAIKTNSDSAYLYYQLGKTYFVQKQYENAIIEFEKAIDFIDNFYYEYSEDLIESYGYSLINTEQYNKALSLYEYEKYYGNKADYIFLLGLIEMNNANFQKSAQTFLKCTEFESGNIEGITTYLPYYNIGVIFECLNMKDYAIDSYEKCGEYSLAIEGLKRLKY